MDYGKLSTSILGAIERKPEDIGAYEDLFSVCQTWAQEDFKAAHRVNKQLRDMCSQKMATVSMSKVEGSTASGVGACYLKHRMSLTATCCMPKSTDR